MPGNKIWWWNQNLNINLVTTYGVTSRVLLVLAYYYFRDVFVYKPIKTDLEISLTVNIGQRSKVKGQRKLVITIWTPWGNKTQISLDISFRSGGRNNPERIDRAPALTQSKT